jgi:hypothetical protein
MRSLGARRTCAQAGQAGPRMHQHRLQHRRPAHTSASKPEAHSSGDTTPGHARTLHA